MEIIGDRVDNIEFGLEHNSVVSLLVRQALLAMCFIGIRMYTRVQVDSMRTWYSLPTCAQHA